MARRSGYTLFEVVLVLALLVLLTGIVYPSFDSMYSDYRVHAAVDQIRALWATARAQAMNDGVPYRFAIVPGLGNCRIAPDTGDFWTTTESPAPPPAENVEDAQPLVQDETLPRGVRCQNGEGAPNVVEGGDSSLPHGTVDLGRWTTIGVFEPEGNTRADIVVTLYSRNARALVVRLRALTGTVTVQRLGDNTVVR